MKNISSCEHCVQCKDKKRCEVLHLLLFHKACEIYFWQIFDGRNEIIAIFAAENTPQRLKIP